MDAPFGGNETAYIYSTTGKYEAIIGIDLINESQNNGEVTKAINYWKAGGLVTCMWHEGAPTVGEGYDASKGTQSNFDNLFVTGSNENKAMLSDWDRIAGHLKKFQDADVPVIWRPFHECSGGWFWWDKSGGASFVKLWKFMFDYFTKTKGLHNLLWFLGYDGSPNAAYNPGEGYFDMVGSDTYSGGGTYAAQYNSCKTIHGTTIPIALHECGVAPDPAANFAQNLMFAWFMVWHTSHIKGMDKTLLSKIYNEPEAITRDELPNFATLTPVNYNLVAEKKTLDFEVRKTSEGFTFLTPFAGVDKIFLFDVQGRVMTSAAAMPIGGNRYSVSVPGLSKGTYMVKVDGQGRTVDKKIVIGR